MVNGIFCYFYWMDGFFKTFLKKQSEQPNFLIWSDDKASNDFNFFGTFHPFVLLLLRELFPEKKLLRGLTFFRPHPHNVGEGFFLGLDQNEFRGRLFEKKFKKRNPLFISI